MALAAVVRIIPWLAGYPLHRDEALYGFWARLIASGQDPLLLTAWVDKPPLVIYLLAASLRLFGVSELVLRLPGMIAGVLLIPATYALARRVYDPWTATLAALFVAASPFAILFAPTAFTDPWLTLWLVIAAWAAVSDRPFWAGLTLGLAVASKQQGILAAPLVIGLLMLTNDGRRTTNAAARRQSSLVGRRSVVVRRWSALILGFALILVPLTYWDSLRWHNRPSFWDRSLTTYGGIAFAPLAEWPQRAVAWAGQLGYLWGAPVLSAVVLGLALWAGIRAWRQSSATSLLICAFVVGYLALHFALTFQAWDRYLLPLIPLVGVLAARGGLAVKAMSDAARDATVDENLTPPAPLSWAGTTQPWREGGEGSRSPSPDDRRWVVRRGGRGVRSFFRAAFALTLASLLVYAGWLGATGRVPVGSDHGAYAGLERVVAVIRARPADAIVYHHSLGWYFDFYLFDARQERRWYDTPAKLAADAGRTVETEPDREQWLAVPDWEGDTISDIEVALAAAGLRLNATASIFRPDGSRSFVLYRILQSEATHGD